MRLQYLTFMERNLEKRKKLTSIQIMNNVSMSSNIVVNSTGMNSANIFNEHAATNSISEKYLDEQRFL